MVRLVGALALFTVTTATNPAAQRFKEWRTANLGPAGHFKEWRRARFGNGFGGWAYWRCTGELSDPSTGAILARIEGVEATRDVGPAAETDGDYLVAPRAARVARRYAYGDAATGAELESKALRPGGPARPVPRPAAYAADVSHGLLADGASVTLRAARGAGDVSPRAATFAATGGGERRVEAYVAADGSPAPPPSSRRFVGFGLGGGASKRLERAQRGLKCRESYVVAGRGPFARPAVTYRRLGECPAWAGPGKLCACDVTMTRVSRRGLFRGASELTRDLAAKLVGDVEGLATKR